MWCGGLSVGPLAEDVWCSLVYRTHTHTTRAILLLFGEEPKSVTLIVYDHIMCQRCRAITQNRTPPILEQQLTGREEHHQTSVPRQLSLSVWSGVVSSRLEGVDRRTTNTILYYSILYYTILYSTLLYYTILYYTILYLDRVCAVDLQARNPQAKNLWVWMSGEFPIDRGTPTPIQWLAKSLADSSISIE